MKKLLLLAVALVMSVCSWAQSGSELEYVKLGTGKYFAQDGNVFYGNGGDYQFYGRYTNPTTTNGFVAFSFAKSESEGDYYTITDTHYNVLVAYDKTHTKMSNHATKTVRPLAGANAEDANYQGNTDWIVKTKGNGFVIGPSLDNANVNWNLHTGYLGMWGTYDQANVIKLVPADVESLNDLLTKVQDSEGCKDVSTLKGGELYSELASQYYGKEPYAAYDFAAAKALVDAYFASTEVYGNEVVNSIIASTVEQPVIYYVHCARQNESYYWNAVGGPTNVPAERAEVAFIAVDGVDNAYYIYNVTASKFMTYTAVTDGKGKTSYADTQDASKYWNITYKETNGGFFEIRPYNGETVANTYMNWNGGVPGYGSNSMGFYKDNGDSDKGSSWAIVKKFTSEEDGPKPEVATLTASLLNGSNEIALSAEEATSVATATGIKFTYENASSYIGYYYTIAKAGEEDPIYGSEMAIGEGTGTDTFDAINFAKGETYQVTVSFFPEGPEFTFDLTGTYEEEEGPTGETVATYTLSTPRGDLFTDGNGYLLSTRSLTLAGSRTETNDKWVIIEAKNSEHGVYIYNVEHNTFIGSNNMNAGGVVKAPMVEEPTMLYRWATGSTDETEKANAYNDKNYKETDYPWCIAEEDGKVNNNYYSINVCNWDDNQGNHTGLRLDKTSKYDDGNIFNIEENGTITKEAYDAIYAKIYGAATEAEVTAAEQLLALTGAGYPTATAEARVALATLLEQEEIGKTELAEAVAAFQASTEIEMPKVGKYYVDAQFVDGSSARMTAKNDVLTFTKVESELEAAYVNVVSVEGNTVVMTIGDKYVHVTCGADAASKEADVDGLTETQGDNTNLTLEVGGAAQFGRFLIQGLTSSNARYYLTTRDDLDGTFAFVANTPNEKFYDTNWNSNGHFRTSYYTFTAVEEEGPTGDEFTFVNNGDGTVTITPANTTNYWYVNVVAQSDIESYGETESEQNGSAVYEAIAEFYSQTEGYQGEQSINVSELYKQVKGEDMTDGSYVITVAYLTEEEIVEGISMVVPDFDSTTARFDYTYGSTTGIANVASAMSSNAIFNLQGQRIVKLQKGINIVGGQKVIK